MVMVKVVTRLVKVKKYFFPTSTYTVSWPSGHVNGLWIRDSWTESQHTTIVLWLNINLHDLPLSTQVFDYLAGKDSLTVFKYKGDT